MKKLFALVLVALSLAIGTIPTADAGYIEATPVASAARTVTGNSAVLDTLELRSEGAGVFDRCRFYLDVTAASGTSPTLNVKIVGVVNGIDFDLTPTFTQKTAVARETILVDECPRFVKIVWTVAGTTPSFTFSVSYSR
jgi:hypothetical protein